MDTITKKGNKKTYCPSCLTRLLWHKNNPHRPFCSERCKNNDFICWSNETHNMLGYSPYDELFSKE